MYVKTDSLKEWYEILNFDVVKRDNSKGWDIKNFRDRFGTRNFERVFGYTEEWKSEEEVINNFLRSTSYKQMLKALGYIEVALQ